MKEIDKEQDGIFKFLSQDEINEMMREKIDALREDKSQPWSETQILYRRQIIYDYIREGLSRQKIQEKIMNDWGCVKRSAQRYLKDALESLEEDNKEFVQKTRDIQRERIEGIITAALAKNNFDAALKALEQINKLDGLYSEKVNAEISAEGFKFNFGTDITNNEQ